MRDTLDLLARGMSDAAHALGAAMAAGRPIALQTTGDSDALAAGIIVRHALTSYFDAPPFAVGDAPANAFRLTLGSELVASEDISGIGRLVTRTAELSVAARAWRLMQLTLMARETLDRGQFLLFDLETGSLRVEQAEILELGVVPFGNGEVAGEGMSTLVRPSGPRAIEPSASNVHGLRWSGSVAAPLPKDVLPAFLDALTNEVVVGHAIEEFDLPVLRRAADRAGLSFQQPALIDVHRLAMRLWPDEMSYRIEDLARKIDPNLAQRAPGRGRLPPDRHRFRQAPPRRAARS